MIDTRFVDDDRPFGERWSHQLLADLATEWQGVLRLTDWSVELVILPERLMDDCYGIARAVRETKQYARVELLDPADYHWSDEAIEPYDPEVTVLHELLHIFTGRMLAEPEQRGTPEDTVAEQLAHHLSNALVALKRQALGAVAA